MATPPRETGINQIISQVNNLNVESKATPRSLDKGTLKEIKNIEIDADLNHIEHLAITKAAIYQESAIPAPEIRETTNTTRQYAAKDPTPEDQEMTTITHLGRLRSQRVIHRATKVILTAKVNSEQISSRIQSALMGFTRRPRLIVRS